MSGSAPARTGNLATLLAATGRYDEAEPLFRQALEIDRKTLGERHPLYATRLNNLASLLKDTGRHEEAESFYRQALEISRDSKTGAELLFEVFSQRYEGGSTLVTSNLPFDEWTEVFGSHSALNSFSRRVMAHTFFRQCSNKIGSK